MKIKHFNKKLKNNNDDLFSIKIIYEFYVYKLKLLEN